MSDSWGVPSDGGNRKPPRKSVRDENSGSGCRKAAAIIAVSLLSAGGVLVYLATEIARAIA